jgi:predicted alpha/beta hydrolase family esterase
MSEWEFADRREWVAALEKDILKSPQPVYLVSHSLGGLTIAHLSESACNKVRGAFIVAPPDLNSYTPPPIVLETFLPLPLKNLPFTSLVVASSNDPYCSIEVAQKMAQAWGSRFINIGEAGHIGSDLDGWPAGLQLFFEFVSTIEED